MSERGGETHDAGRVAEARIRRMVMAVIVAYVAAVVLSATAVFVAIYAISESERKWCGLLNVMHSAYQSGTPTTQIGRNLATNVSRLRSDFGCADVGLGE